MHTFLANFSAFGFDCQTYRSRYLFSLYLLTCFRTRKLFEFYRLEQKNSFNQRLL